MIIFQMNIFIIYFDQTNISNIHNNSVLSSKIPINLSDLEGNINGYIGTGEGNNLLENSENNHSIKNIVYKKGPAILRFEYQKRDGPQDPFITSELTNDLSVAGDTLIIGGEINELNINVEEA